MTERNTRTPRITRREAMGALGSGIGLGAVAALGRFDTLFAASQGGAQPTSPTGAIIRTILRDVPPAQLGNGTTLMHEHISLSNPVLWNATGRIEWPGNQEAPPKGFMQDVDWMTEEVRAAGRDGVACIVDAGGKDLGRSTADLRTIATRVPEVHIVSAGGLHTQPRYPHEVYHMSEDQIADWFTADARAERWGALGEIGTSVEMTPEERKVHRAVGKVAVRTGLPILTHTSGGCEKCTADQLDAFEAVGVNLRSVAIGHLNDIRDVTAATPKAIAKRGAFVAFDHSNPMNARVDEHVKMIVSVLDAGYENHVLLSADWANEALTKRKGGPGLAIVLTAFVPRLKAAGMTDAVLRKIMVDNPRRLLAFVPKTT